MDVLRADQVIGGEPVFLETTVVSVIHGTLVSESEEGRRVVVLFCDDGVTRRADPHDLILTEVTEVTEKPTVKASDLTPGMVLAAQSLGGVTLESPGMVIAVMQGGVQFCTPPSRHIQFGVFVHLNLEGVTQDFYVDPEREVLIVEDPA